MFQNGFNGFYLSTMGGMASDRERRKQISRDRYYMGVAKAVERGANCYGTHVGAVVVLGNRVVSTGYNGTPAGFPNCDEGGCVRCRDSWLYKHERGSEMSDPSHVAGAALDRCVCVHAEQNAFLTAARFGIPLEGATLYTTVSPCFGCLKEATQVGIQRVIYKRWYEARYSRPLAEQYIALYTHLMGDSRLNFETLGGGRPQIEAEGQPDPYADLGDNVIALKPPA